MSLLNVQHLDITFETFLNHVHAVQDVSFSVNKGEFVCIVGESGCGKSVTLKEIMRLNKGQIKRTKDSHIIFDDQDILSLDKDSLRLIRGNRISMIFQDSLTSLNPTMTVEDQIGEALDIHLQLQPSQRRNKIIDLLKQVEIPDPEGHLLSYPHQLSGGMRQRVMIAMALACQPDLLLADEPTTALDVTIQSQILKLLKKLQHDMSLTIILVTHDLSIARHYAQRIIVMYAGKIVEEGTTDDIFNDASHPYTIALQKAIPQFDVKRRTTLYTIEGTPPDLTQKSFNCPFAPRCEESMRICHRREPVQTHLSSTHKVSCWNVERRNIYD